MGDPTPDRLRVLADDCEERARLSRDDDARSLYWRAAKDARQASASRHMTEGERREVLAAMTAQAQVARWYDGEGPFPDNSDILSAGIGSYIPEMRGAVSYQSNIHLTTQADSPPIEALNPRQLATLFAMSERTARRAIERGVRKGLPGFYRDGCHWLADPEAFERLRQGRVSELCPNGSAGVRSAHDSANHA